MDYYKPFSDHVIQRFDSGDIPRTHPRMMLKSNKVISQGVDFVLFDESFEDYLYV